MRKLVKSNRGVLLIPLFAIFAAVSIVYMPGTVRAQIYVGSAGGIGEYTTSGTSVWNDGGFGAIAAAISGTNLFVANENNGTIGEYTTAGTTVNSSLISVSCSGLAVSGTDIYVCEGDSIAEYTTSGVLVTSTLITGLSALSGGAYSIAVSGTDIFVGFNGNAGAGRIGEYTTSGGTVDDSLVTGLAVTEAYGIAVSGSDIFVTSQNNGTFGEYTTSGGTVSAAVLPDFSINSPWGIAVSGTDVYVTSDNNGTVGEYTTAGGTVNSALITGLNQPQAIVAVPEPSAFTMLAAGFGLLFLFGGSSDLQARFSRQNRKRMKIFS